MSTSISSHIECVLAKYESRFSGVRRFEGGSRLLAKFRRVAADVVAKTCPVRAMHEVHNELCVADALLNQSVVQLSYEPTLNNTKKTIDFRATTEQRQVVLMDVKTIHPEPVDGWPHFLRGREEGWAPESVDLQ